MPRQLQKKNKRTRNTRLKDESTVYLLYDIYFDNKYQREVKELH